MGSCPDTDIDPSIFVMNTTPFVEFKPTHYQGISVFCFTITLRVTLFFQVRYLVLLKSWLTVQ